MKYKVTGLIVCALIVIVVTVFSLSCEKNPLAPGATSEDLTLESTETGDNISLASDIPPPPPRITGIYNLGTLNDRLRSIKLAGDSAGKSYVILYEHADYKGRSEVFIANDPNFDGYLWFPGNDVGNDKVSSVKLKRGARCTLYKHSKYGTPKLTLTSSCKNLRDKGFNDCASSIKVSNITAKGVVLYENDYAGEYGGRPGMSWVLFKNCNYLYRKDEDMGIGLSMIKLVNICNAKLYKNPYYIGSYYLKEDLVPIDNGEIILDCGKDPGPIK
jgi:hypothetical protein